MGDGTILAYCTTCGGSIDADWLEGIDYVTVGDEQFVHTECYHGTGGPMGKQAEQNAHYTRMVGQAKIAKLAPVAEDAIARGDHAVALNRKLNEFWQAELDNAEESINVAEVARRGEGLFRGDPDFQQHFFETYLYAVIYDKGQQVVGNTRKLNYDAPDLNVIDGDWLEYSGGENRRLDCMTSKQLREASERRRRWAVREIQRADMLEEAARQVSQGKKPSFPAVARQVQRATPEAAPPPETASAAVTADYPAPTSGPAEDEDDWGPTAEMRRVLGHTLARSRYDYWTFFAGMRNGSVIEYCQAQDLDANSLWLMVSNWKVWAAGSLPGEGEPLMADNQRALQVRLDDIVWVMDQPS
jgi:hypothetical protein